MHDHYGPLGDLVRRLDALCPDPSLTNLAHALQTAAVTMGDVAGYVRETAASYHRASVVRREQYELLVMTWRPGQGSAPHDHAGSLSALRVLQGKAMEGCWRVAPDGYADLQFETPVNLGELTAWQDAGVHTVRNAEQSEPALVTLHVYAPPLRDFRRFTPRPQPAGAPVPAVPRAESKSKTIVIVGGGFSGSMTAAQLLRRASASGSAVRVALVERQGTVGEGLAYGTRELSHLLNVPAGRMSAWPDRPDDFVRWAAERHGKAAPGDFLPRRWYGEYVREALLKTAEQAHESARLSVVFDEVRRIARRPDGGWMVNFARGPSLPADVVVLALGHRPPPDPIKQVWSGPRGRFIADPWRPFAVNPVRADEPVVVLGSGLTAVDAVLSLAQEPRRAPITLISRRGLVPQSHVEVPSPPVDLQPLVTELLAAPNGLCIRSLRKRVRGKVREVAASGQDWRAVIDGLRPHMHVLWRALPVGERRKFLRHLRPYWEVHRHRMALAVAQQFGALVKQGVVRIVAGTVAAAQAADDGVRLFVRERGEERLIELRAGWVVNCTGPAASNSAESNPVIGSLLVHGWVRPDELALGLETGADGNAIDAAGRPAQDLFVVGTLRKPAFWESTAVPELRNQAAAVAECILRAVPKDGRLGLRMPETNGSAAPAHTGGAAGA
jgi:uncharacterized NAD(P)/FAD-binding protein YdhS